MYLPQTVEYALRAMSQLALMSPERTVRAKDLSGTTGIPVHFLSKILRRLVTAHLLISQKGCQGGFVLARPRDEIRFIDILRAVHYKFEEEHCVFGWKECNSKKPCPLHDSWSEMKTIFQNWAEQTTLADVKAQK